ncbi:MAG: hypothetical protein DHS20C12_04180 [Pseudohongiella sp.]|nr:MAG: hypothetical protein DHS20C12_04180 [Pseudohongiella sp.]
MKISKRERNILMLAALVAVVFVFTSGWPAVKSVYAERQGNIESVEIDIAREQRLIENSTNWRERRAEVESQIAALQSQTFSGETVAIVEANIQRALSAHARDSGITVSSTRLAEQLVTEDWLLIRQEMQFRTSDQANTARFLESLENSTPRLRVTAFNVSRSRNQYSGSITVVGFARSEGLVNTVASNR